MVHSYEIMNRVSNRIEILLKDYTGSMMARSISSAPDFIAVCINRAIDVDSSIIIDPNQKISVTKTTVEIVNDDNFSPIYISLATSINKPIVDKTAIAVDFKKSHGAGIAYIVVIPETIFQTNKDYCIHTILDIFFGIVNIDTEMEYKASPSILKFASSNKIKISMYDITTMLSACCFVKFACWTLFGGYTYSDKEIASIIAGVKASTIIPKLSNILKKYNSPILIREGLSTGSIAADFLY